VVGVFSSSNTDNEVQKFPKGNEETVRYREFLYCVFAYICVLGEKINININPGTILIKNVKQCI
jgi:hypothetical protein